MGKIKTLKDLFIKENSYIVELPINNEYYLFVEGLDEYGETLASEKFDIEKIEMFCIELFSNKYCEYIETIDNYGMTLEETIKDLKEKTLSLIGVLDVIK